MSGRLSSGASGAATVLTPGELLRAMFDAALMAADPETQIPRALGEAYWTRQRTIVLGAGKAAARMARAVELSWRSAGAVGELYGMVVTRYGHAVECERIEVLEAAHPVPDAASAQAAGRILELAGSARAGDRVLALISGGGSALLAAPPPGLTLEDKQAVFGALLASGAPISEVNLVRRHLSAVKNGLLAQAAAPAATRVLLISDIPGDQPATIASGPFLADESRPADASAVLRRHGIRAPRAVVEWLEREPARAPSEPAPSVTHEVIAAPQRSLEAAAAVARSHQVTPVILGDALQGESREVGTVLAGVAEQVRRHGQPHPPPCVLLSGGETTVTMRGSGCGGPNVELLLAFALAARHLTGVHALACDTDGIDGAAEVAGALADTETIRRAASLGIDPRAALADNDAHTFFAALGDQVVTGPTLTNVNDFRAVLVT